MNKPFVQRKKIVLFIDTGDNCRAPMAKGYLEKLMRERGIKHVEVITAGVMTRNGLLPTAESVQMLQEEGEDIRTHRSKPMTWEMLENADLILGMGAFQVQKATRTNANAKGKTYLLKEYVGLTGKNVQISDPMGGTMEVYKKIFGELKAAINLLIDMELFTNPPPELLTSGSARPLRRLMDESKLAAAKASQVESLSTIDGEAKEDSGENDEELTPESTASDKKKGPTKAAAGKARAASDDKPREVRRGRPPKAVSEANKARSAKEKPAKKSATATKTSAHAASAKKAEKAAAPSAKKATALPAKATKPPTKTSTSKTAAAPEKKPGKPGRPPKAGKK